MQPAKYHFKRGVLRSRSRSLSSFEVLIQLGFNPDRLPLQHVNCKQLRRLRQVLQCDEAQRRSPGGTAVWLGKGANLVLFLILAQTGDDLPDSVKVIPSLLS